MTARPSAWFIAAAALAWVLVAAVIGCASTEGGA